MTAQIPLHICGAKLTKTEKSKVLVLNVDIYKVYLWPIVHSESAKGPIV